MNRPSLPPTQATACALLLGGLLLLAGPAAHAQTAPRPPDRQWGSWTINTLVLPGGPKGWGGYFELQGRANAIARQFFYNEIKGGVSYDITNNFTVLLGTGRYSTADYRDLSAGYLALERRLWQQFTFTQPVGRVKLEHRFRVEQRWTRFRDDVVPVNQARYRGRQRYRLSAVLPLNNPTMQPGTAFLSVYNEVFFDPRGPYFERNRVYAGGGVQLNRNVTVQAAWLNQIDYRPARAQPGTGLFIARTRQAKDNLVLTLVYRIVRARADEKPAPFTPFQPD
ncbi:DUF2490 domain-containing protein [Hymenobacter psychrophilus]|uniref:DUF2490 domain-containing protein n=1 Tax=Hymenobacter psychrophilus TaxID=651662 RepID=A0A1H3I3E5_9BACT|nr:DUF2490 domain-containing protein [Hymenobacter psychrophilus]SDY21534.1 Protein of unknown function [Hymenobacter psychrophilus]